MSNVKHMAGFQINYISKENHLKGIQRLGPIGLKGMNRFRVKSKGDHCADIKGMIPQVASRPDRLKLKVMGL